MSKIFRYELDVTPRQVIDMPLGSRLLSIAPGRMDEYHVDLWALVPKEAPAVHYAFEIFGTGHPMPDYAGELIFLGTAVMPDALVWHVFSDPNPIRIFRDE